MMVIIVAYYHFHCYVPFDVQETNQNTCVKTAFGGYPLDKEGLNAENH